MEETCRVLLVAFKSFLLKFISCQQSQFTTVYIDCPVYTDCPVYIDCPVYTDWPVYTDCPRVML